MRHPQFPARFPAIALWAIMLCALTHANARAETIDVSDKSSAAPAELTRPGVKVRIVGPCESACGEVLSRVPRKQICVVEGASLGFRPPQNVADSKNEKHLLYPYDIRAWLHQKAGLKQEAVRMEAPEIYRFFRKC
jgi:hypothetical protein